MIKYVVALVSFMFAFPKSHKAISSIYLELADQLKDIWEINRVAATISFARYLNTKMPLPDKWYLEFNKIPADKCNAGADAVMACYPSQFAIFVDPEKLNTIKLLDMMYAMRHEWQHVVQAYEVATTLVELGHPEMFGQAWDRFATKGGYIFNELETDARLAACAELRAPLINLRERTIKYVKKHLK